MTAGVLMSRCRRTADALDIGEWLACANARRKSAPPSRSGANREPEPRWTCGCPRIWPTAYARENPSDGGGANRPSMHKTEAGCAPSAVEEASLYRYGDCMRPVIGSELGENILHMRLDRGFRHREFNRDDLVGRAQGNATQYFHLPLRECIICDVLQECFGDFGRYSSAAGMHDANGFRQILPNHVFQQVSRCSRLERAKRLYVSLVGGEDNEAGGRKLPADGFDRIDTVHDRHL